MRDSERGRETESGRIEDFEELYRELAINCFRYFGFTSFEQVDRLTIAQYEIMVEAARLREVDKDYRDHLQAFLNFRVKAKKKAGKNRQKPVYPTFKKFYDYEDAINQVKQKNKPDRFEKMKRLLRGRDS